MNPPRQCSEGCRGTLYFAGLDGGVGVEAQGAFYVVLAMWCQTNRPWRCSHTAASPAMPTAREPMLSCSPSTWAGLLVLLAATASDSDIEQLEIPLPPLTQQRRIAQILGGLDDKIELNRRMNETLEQMSRALFKSWFVDFAPVRAKMDGRWQRGQSLPGLPAELYDLFPARLIPSELGEIPEGWGVGVVGDELAELVSGQRPRGGAVKEGVPSIGAENVIGIGKYDFNREKYIPADFFERLKKRGADVRNGDVLLYKDGAQIGRKTYFDGDFPHRQCAVNEHIFILRLRNRQAQRYLYFWLDQHWITREIVALNSNSAQPGINQTGVRSLPLMLPPAEVIAAVNGIIAPLTERIFANSQESCALARLRDTLLPRLVSGELRVG